MERMMGELEAYYEHILNETAPRDGADSGTYADLMNNAEYGRHHLSTAWAARPMTFETLESHGATY